jgi:nitroreductase
VILLSYFSADLYVARYAEADKAGSGLGEGADRWTVPYWAGDAAFGVMALLLGAVDAGLGACILGTFRGEQDLASRLGVPDDWHLFSAVALGRPDGLDHPSPSLSRPRPTTAERIHRGRW